MTWPEREFYVSVLPYKRIDSLKVLCNNTSLACWFRHVCGHCLLSRRSRGANEKWEMSIMFFEPKICALIHIPASENLLRLRRSKIAFSLRSRSRAKIIRSTCGKSNKRSKRRYFYLQLRVKKMCFRTTPVRTFFHNSGAELVINLKYAFLRTDVVICFFSTSLKISGTFISCSWF